LLLLLCLGLTPAVGLLAAVPDIQPPTNGFLPRSDEREAEPRISMSQASSIARRNFPEGRVLSVRLENRRWRVRMDQEGTVFNVFVDADSGRTSRPSEED
jgi:uncharacterized membrane protein YkoI